MKRNSGFTLIELLASVAILMIIVWIMAVIFAETDRAWNLGTGRAESNTEGRAALQMLTHDLQYAVADSVLTFHMGPDRNKDTVAPYGLTSDEICAVSIQHDSDDGTRAAREVHYYVIETPDSPGKYQLQRGYFAGELSSVSNAAMHAYHNRQWWKPTPIGAGRPGSSQVIAENVASLAFYAPDPRTGDMIREYDSDALYASNQLPEYVDVLLEVLNQREAEQVAQMENSGLPDLTIKEFVERNVRRYTSRVYFQNRLGYKER